MDDSLQIWLCLLHVNRCLPPRPSIHDCCMWTGACLRPSIHDCVCCVCTGARPCDLCANRCPPPDIIHPWLSVMWTGACSRPWLCVVCGEVHAPIRDCVCCVCIVWTGACRQTSSIRDCVCFVWTGARLQTSSIRDCVFCVNSVSVLREQVPAPKPHPSVTHWLCVLCVNRCQPPNLIHLWLTDCVLWTGACPPHPSVTHCVCCVWTGARPQTSSIRDSLTVCIVCVNRCPPPNLIHLWLTDCVYCVNRCLPPNLTLTVCIVCVNRCMPPNLIHPWLIDCVYCVCEQVPAPRPHPSWRSWASYRRHKRSWRPRSSSWLPSRLSWRLSARRLTSEFANSTSFSISSSPLCLKKKKKLIFKIFF